MYSYFFNFLSWGALVQNNWKRKWKEALFLLLLGYLVQSMYSLSVIQWNPIHTLSLTYEEIPSFTWNHRDPEKKQVTFSLIWQTNALNGSSSVPPYPTCNFAGVTLQLVRVTATEGENHRVGIFPFLFSLTWSNSDRMEVKVWKTRWKIRVKVTRTPPLPCPHLQFCQRSDVSRQYQAGRRVPFLHMFEHLHNCNFTFVLSVVF